MIFDRLEDGLRPNRVYSNVSTPGCGAGEVKGKSDLSGAAIVSRGCVDLAPILEPRKGGKRAEKKRGIGPGYLNYKVLPRLPSSSSSLTMLVGALSSSREQLIEYLRTLPSIRERCGRVHDFAKQDKLQYFNYHPEKEGDVTNYCIRIIQVSSTPRCYAYSSPFDAFDDTSVISGMIFHP